MCNTMHFCKYIKIIDKKNINTETQCLSITIYKDNNGHLTLLRKNKKIPIINGRPLQFATFL